MRVVLDTNVLVAAGFNPRSSSAAIREAVRDGRLQLVWNARTLDETRHIIRKIPPLRWSDVEGLYVPEHEHRGETHPERFAAVEDPADRHFAALAEAADAVLVSNDDHLLSVRGRIPASVQTPGEFAAEHL